MRVRWIGLALALVLVGGAIGYGAGVMRAEEPTTFAQAVPVPASGPSIPVIPVKVNPDPTVIPPLRTDLRLRPRTVGAAPFDLTLPIPRGWLQTNPTSGAWNFYPPPGAEGTANTYFLRVRLVGNSFRPVEAARDQRLADLDNAAEVQDLTVEKLRPGGFLATYVAEGYRRVSYEQFVDSPGSTFAYASIALIGREADREGMADLFPRILAGVRAQGG